MSVGGELVQHSRGAIRVRFRRTSRGARVPVRASAGSAGWDLSAALDGPLVLEPGRRQAVPTGLVLEIPPGYEAQVRPRSGRAAREGLTVLNGPGTIDSDYRGEVRVLLVNLGEASITIEPGDRLAQLVVSPVLEVRWEESEGPLDETARGSGGFGSTGR